MNKSFSTMLFNMKRAVLYLLPLLFLTSCQSYSLYHFQGLEAPSIVIPSDVKTIGFVDRNTSFEIDSLNKIYMVDDNVIRDSTDYTEVIAKNCYVGFIESFSDDLGIDSINYISLNAEVVDGGRDYSPLKWNIVDSICSKTTSDILICLEDIQIFNKYSIIINEGYYGITDINHFSAWRVYDPLDQSIIDEQIVQDSLFTEELSYSYNKLIAEKLPKRSEIFRDVAYEIGSNYADLFIPKWINLKRKYFISGDNRLSVAKYYLAQENWDAMIILWKEIANEDDDKLAGRACYNLALAYEVKEDFMAANQWIRKSIFHYKKMKSKSVEFEMVKEYTMELIKRTKNKKKLDLFFKE
ncbi:MAG: hypothetical protein JEZ01_16715 [Labilibaculum sp.]|nr:DUF6340 family protein [Labilibaculum sp.]MBI9059407.1 hypothetical protein [Labilibaculum sp.]